MIPYVFSHDITSVSPIFNYNDKNRCLIRSFQEGFVPKKQRSQFLEDRMELEDEVCQEDVSQDDLECELCLVLMFIIGFW